MIHGVPVKTYNALQNHIIVLLFFKVVLNTFYSSGILTCVSVLHYVETLIPSSLVD